MLRSIYLLITLVLFMSINSSCQSAFGPVPKTYAQMHYEDIQPYREKANVLDTLKAHCMQRGDEDSAMYYDIKHAELDLECYKHERNEDGEVHPNPQTIQILQSQIDGLKELMRVSKMFDDMLKGIAPPPPPKLKKNNISKEI